MSDLPRLPMLDEKHALENSYRNFHAKGLEYICLRRHPALTEKIYIFDGDVSKLPEVVNPHDHRYNFDTQVLAGAMENINYRRMASNDPFPCTLFQEFEYMTPLNGGKGFVWKKPTTLRVASRQSIAKGESYALSSSCIHTIRMLENETVLLLRQYSDVVPLAWPTTTFTLDREPPSLDGLYERWTEADLIDRLRKIEDRIGRPLVEIP